MVTIRPTGISNRLLAYNMQAPQQTAVTSQFNSGGDTQVFNAPLSQKEPEVQKTESAWDKFIKYSAIIGSIVLVAGGAAVMNGRRRELNKYQTEFQKQHKNGIHEDTIKSLQQQQERNLKTLEPIKKQIESIQKELKKDISKEKKNKLQDELNKLTKEFNLLGSQYSVIENDQIAVRKIDGTAKTIPNDQLEIEVGNPGLYSSVSIIDGSGLSQSPVGGKIKVQTLSDGKLEDRTLTTSETNESEGRYTTKFSEPGLIVNKEGKVQQLLNVDAMSPGVIWNRLLKGIGLQAA